MPLPPIPALGAKGPVPAAPVAELEAFGSSDMYQIAQSSSRAARSKHATTTAGLIASLTSARMSRSSLAKASASTPAIAAEGTSALSGNCLSRGRLLLWPDLAPALTILGEIYPHYLINHLRLGHAAPVRNLCSESAVLDRDVAAPSRKLQCEVHLFDHRVKVGHGDWVPMDAVNVKLEAAG